MNKSILSAAVMLAVGTVALRSPEGERVYVPDGQPLPAWTPESARAELLGLGALRPAQPTVGELAELAEASRFDLRTISAEARTELERGAAEAVIDPGGSVNEILGGEPAPATAGTDAQQSTGDTSGAGTNTTAADEATATEGAQETAPAGGKASSRAKKATA